MNKKTKIIVGLIITSVLAGVLITVFFYCKNDDFLIHACL